MRLAPQHQNAMAFATHDLNHLQNGDGTTTSFEGGAQGENNNGDDGLHAQFDGDVNQIDAEDMSDCGEEGCFIPNLFRFLIWNFNFKINIFQFLTKCIKYNLLIILILNVTGILVEPEEAGDAAIVKNGKQEQAALPQSSQPVQQPQQQQVFEAFY